ncbi:hypothetical protein QTP88_024154 [Uroleucon formosanum]
MTDVEEKPHYAAKEFSENKNEKISSKRAHKTHKTRECEGDPLVNRSRTYTERVSTPDGQRPRTNRFRRRASPRAGGRAELVVVSGAVGPGAHHLLPTERTGTSAISETRPQLWRARAYTAANATERKDWFHPLHAFGWRHCGPVRRRTHSGGNPVFLSNSSSSCSRPRCSRRPECDTRECPRRCRDAMSVRD